MTVPTHFTLYSRGIWLTLAVLVVFSALFAFYVHSEKQIDHANALRYQSNLLAEELRQSSDDLTHSVRSYVLTGQPIFKQHYLEILDIRDGKRPRPVNYHDIYWDLVLADNQRPRPYGQTVALLDLMRQAGFTDEEFAKLAKAKAKSDALTSTEFKAMKLIESTAAPTDADKLKASIMLRDTAYFKAKFDIMKPISEFNQMVDKRTLNAVHSAERNAYYLRVLFGCFGLLLIVMLWLTYFNRHKVLLKWVEERTRALQKSETVFRSTFEAAPIGVTNFSLDGRLLAVNQGYCEMLGYSRDELLNKAYRQLTAAEYHQLDAEMISKTLAGEIPEFNHEKQYIRKNGERVWCHSWVKLICNAQGLPDYFIGVIQDISIQREREQQLGLFHSLFEMTSDCVFMISPKHDYRFVFVNEATCRHYGLEREQLLKWRIPDWDANFKSQADLDALWQQIKARKCCLLETTHTVASGRQVPVEVSGNYLTYQGEEYIAGYFHDITARKQDELELRKFKDIIDSTDDAIISKSLDGMIESWNESAEKIFGYSSTEAVGQSIDMLIPAEQLNDEMNIMARIERGERVGQYETVRAHKDGRLVNIATTQSPILDNAGKVVGYSKIARDITARKKAELEINIAATVFESMEGMMVTDVNGTILRVNSAFSTITGYSAEEIVGLHPRVLNSGRQDAAFYQALWDKVLEIGVWEGEVWNRRKNGEMYPEHLIITAVKNAEGVLSHYVATFNDISLAKAAEEEIKKLAYYDPLTHLPNRRLLRDKLQQAVVAVTRSGLNCALLFIDLDNFKILNDTLGHDVGDLLLQQVAERLQCCVREGDTVARLGGDEFVVMLQNLSKDSIIAATQAKVIGHKIIDTLNLPYQLGRHEHINTPSIGATLFNDNFYTLDELMKQADIAMYQSKNSGRNTLRFFDLQMQAAVNARASLEAALRKALEYGQFQLYYQLQVDGLHEPGSHRSFGAEALIRWVHPERGLIAPAEFIPLAEETGVILSIGQWVLETACAQIKAWQQDTQTQKLTLAVNISPKQFRQADFVLQIQALLQRYAIEPMRLKLEMTESALLEDIEESIMTMNALNNIGVQFSLDDFGTGYSSLQYLKRLPLHQLKIDQSFVRDFAHDSNDRAIVGTIIAMADSLGMNVIAEGVETKEQLQLLFKKGCTHYQGYLFGRPMPIEQFDALVKQG